MDLSQRAPLALAERRLAWLDARQRVLAQNIANADTPGYRRRREVKGRPIGANLASADDVARQGIERLPFGPVHNVGQADDAKGHLPASASNLATRHASAPPKRIRRTG